LTRGGSYGGCSKIGKGRITKRTVDAAKAREIDSYLWDQELSGFGLKVTPAGRKVYLVQYQLGGRKGRTRRVTIGRHGELRLGATPQTSGTGQGLTSR
jgi:hypothetical protein